MTRSPSYPGLGIFFGDDIRRLDFFSCMGKLPALLAHDAFPIVTGVLALSDTTSDGFFILVTLMGIGVAFFTTEGKQVSC